MQEIIEQALEKAKTSQEHWQDVYDKAKEDLRFMSDDDYSQWNSQDVKSRRDSGKPVLQIDQLAQFVNQVSNDVRMNTPSINIIPSDGGDEETAQIIEGKLREIQKKSNADACYDNAVNFAIRCGIGYIRVDHDYASNTSFTQDFKIERVINPFSVLFDPESINTDGSDAKCCIVLDSMTEDAFKAEYPDKDPVSFEIDGHTAQEDEITIAEYFYIDESPLYIARTYEGQMIESDTPFEDETIFERTRKSTKRIVKRYLLSGVDVLKESIFPSDYIPVVPVYGEEAWLDGERNLISLIRRAKDSQRMYNYWASLETELLMKAPKAPVIAVEGTTEDYAEDWTNPDKAAVLRYTGTDSQNRPAAPPQFAPPVQIPAGIVNARQQTTNDIRATMGLYDSFLGQSDNAISGVAIGNRQREGDRAVYHFSDNLTRAITQVGRIIMSGFKTLYSEPMVMSIIGKEETDDKVAVNTPNLLKGQDRPYDLTTGDYSVYVVTGANYATMRQEAAEFFRQVVTGQPELMPIMGDLLFKYQDFAGAEALSERIKKTIDPKLLDDELDPQVMAMQAENERLTGELQFMQVQLGELQKKLEDKQTELQIKMQSESNDHKLDISKLRLDEQKVAGELAIKKQEIDLKRQEIELRSYELGLKTNQTAHEQNLDNAKAVNEVLKEVGELTPSYEGVNYE